MPDGVAVTDNTAASRLEVTVDGHLAHLRYVVHGDDLVLVHTEVPEEVGGRGIAGALVAAAVDRARRDGLSIAPWCPYARRWLEQHPDEMRGVDVDWDSRPPSAGRRRPAPSWPAPPTDWAETRDALHLWTQVIGKVRLALEPMLNHWWQVPLYLSARGLTTSLMHHPHGGLDIELDLVDSAAVFRTTDGRSGRVALEPQSVADFHRRTLRVLDDLGMPVQIVPRPVEVPTAVPFDEDVRRREYDADAARAHWQVLLQAQRVLAVFRARFVGKASPVHWFWGGADLATTRFSGRAAPTHPGGVPNCPDWVQELAYSHEVSSSGYWAEGGPGGSFYAYAYPEPPGFRDWPMPPGTTYDETMGEFLLPYDTVRAASDPDALVLDFLQATYEAAADLGGWDRAALEASAALTPKGRR